MFNNRSSARPNIETINHISHNEWLKKRQERLQRNLERKRKRPNYLKNFPKYTAVIEKIEPEKNTFQQDAVAEIHKPQFNQCLYWFLLFLFYLPGYFYKKHFEKPSNATLTDKKAVPSIISKPIPAHIHINPFSADELAAMYQAKEIPVRTIDEIKQMKKEVAKLKSASPAENKPHTHKSYFTCFDCFFKTPRSFTKSERINLQSRSIRG